eukprot:gnl/TRDRNA2_/TRDRNA2_180660_c0_seq1.p1 gnl/TRDRNA2_/TRDRNA2_180660_c0~~gnl/TRDRNA2_/TRDRNA2_180660_c0_seq1.p1  ORF type:complete len:598 (+),score=136.76 gnl/TRDRNA2_/TRDRNA2_180660_c0_seq1:79-1872(+)
MRLLRKFGAGIALWAVVMCIIHIHISFQHEEEDDDDFTFFQDKVQNLQITKVRKRQGVAEPSPAAEATGTGSPPSGMTFAGKWTATLKKEMAATTQAPPAKVSTVPALAGKWTAAVRKELAAMAATSGPAAALAPATVSVASDLPHPEQEPSLTAGKWTATVTALASATPVSEAEMTIAPVATDKSTATVTARESASPVTEADMTIAPAAADKSTATVTARESAIPVTEAKDPAGAEVKRQLAAEAATPGVAAAAFAASTVAHMPDIAVAVSEVVRSAQVLQHELASEEGAGAEVISMFIGLMALSLLVLFLWCFVYFPSTKEASEEQTTIRRVTDHLVRTLWSNADPRGPAPGRKDNVVSSDGISIDQAFNANCLEFFPNRLGKAIDADTDVMASAAASLLASPVATTDSADSMKYGQPPPLCPNLVLPTTEVRFAVPVQTLLSIATGEFDVVGVLGNPLLRADVKEVPGGRQLQLAMALPCSLPRVTIRPLLQEASDSTDGRLEIRGPHQRFYGTIEAEGPNLFVVIVEDKVVMMISGDGDGFLVQSGTKVKMADVLRSGDNYGGVDHMQLHVSPDVDPVLVLSCVLAVAMLRKN